MAEKSSVPTPGIIVPPLVVRDAAEAFVFYEQAFGVEVLHRSPSPSGAGEHMHLKIWKRSVRISCPNILRRTRRL